MMNESGRFYLALLIEQIAGFVVMPTALVALLYLWRKTGFFRWLYLVTAVLIVALNLLWLWGGGVVLWQRAVFGPSDPFAHWYEEWNFVTFWLLLVFFSVPVWHRWRSQSAPANASPRR
jgi:hypothetical protein